MISHNIWRFRWLWQNLKKCMICLNILPNAGWKAAKFYFTDLVPPFSLLLCESESSLHRVWILNWGWTPQRTHKGKGTKYTHFIFPNLVTWLAADLALPTLCQVEIHQRYNLYGFGFIFFHLNFEIEVAWIAVLVDFLYNEDPALGLPAA